jgi:RNase adaptor protein for sRNA GlmZ degradation
LEADTGGGDQLGTDGGELSVPWISAVVTSFGYGHGAAPEADVELDVRTMLRNPHVDPAMRCRTGLDADVHDHVMNTPGARNLVSETTLHVINLLRDGFDRESRLARVAVGCVGGRHRSVALAVEIAAALGRAGVGADVVHRDVDKAVIQPAVES